MRMFVCKKAFVIQSHSRLTYLLGSLLTICCHTMLAGFGRARYVLNVSLTIAQSDGNAGLLHLCFMSGGPGSKEFMRLYTTGLQRTFQTLEAELHSPSMLLEPEAHAHRS